MGPNSYLPEMTSTFFFLVHPQCSISTNKNVWRFFDVKITMVCNLIVRNAFGARSFRLIKFNEAELAQRIELAGYTSTRKSCAHQVLCLCCAFCMQSFSRIFCFSFTHSHTHTHTTALAHTCFIND